VSPEDLEAHLRANPDDVAGWSAYSDYLTDQGDPRGEFMRVQLALEDSSVEKDVRKRLRKKEEELIDDFGREWVGKTLAKKLVGEADYDLSRHNEIGFQRGMFTAVRGVTFTRRTVDALAKAKTTGWLVELDGRMPTEPCSLRALTKAAFLPGLQMINLVEPYYWANTFNRELDAVLRRTVRLRRLSLDGDPLRLTEIGGLDFPNLTELTIRNVSPGNLPLTPIAENASLTNVRKLALSATDDGVVSPLPEGLIEPLVRSRHLKNLADLSLDATPDGSNVVEPVRHSGILRRLERLDLGPVPVDDEVLVRILELLRAAPHPLQFLTANVLANPARLQADFQAVGVKLYPAIFRREVRLPDEAEDDGGEFSEDWE
jgi:uncharacterized protein (TIGR02996 family)